MSSDLFGSGGGGGVGGLSHRPSINDSFGLRQRNNVHSKLSASDNNKTNIETENLHPNNHNPLNNKNKNSVQTFGKWGSSISNVRAPPRMSLASGGKYATPNRNNLASASNQQQQHKTDNIEMNTSNNRTATQSSAIVETPNCKSNTKIIEYKSKIRTEADIMLYPDEYDGVYNTTNGISTLDSICERVLGWFFFWPN